MTKCLLSILVPTLRPDKLRELIRSIDQNTKCKYEILTTSESGGIYKAVNKLYSRAKGEYVVQLPDDVQVTYGWERMLKFLDKADDMTIGNFQMSRKMLRGDGVKIMRPINYYGKEVSVFPIHRRQLTNRIEKYMDETFVSFFGDIDLSLRVWKSGGKVITCPGAIIFTDNQKDEVHKKSFDNYHEQDKIKFMERWGKIWHEN